MRLRTPLWERPHGRFVPRYSMVTFSRMPYATAFERGQVQRKLLEDATRDLQSVEQVDMQALDQHIETALGPL